MPWHTCICTHIHTIMPISEHEPEVPQCFRKLFSLLLKLLSTAPLLRKSTLVLGSFYLSFPLLADHTRKVFFHSSQHFQTCLLQCFSDFLLLLPGGLLCSIQWARPAVGSLNPGFLFPQAQLTLNNVLIFLLIASFWVLVCSQWGFELTILLPHHPWC